MLLNWKHNKKSLEIHLLLTEGQFDVWRCEMLAGMPASQLQKDALFYYGSRLSVARGKFRAQVLPLKP